MRERMAAGQRDVHRVVEQVHALDAVVLRRGKPVVMSSTTSASPARSLAIDGSGLGGLERELDAGWRSRNRAIASA